MLQTLAVLLGTYLVFFTAYWLIPQGSKPPAWIASSGEPPPKRFRYVMYPRTNAEPAYNAPDGEPVGVLDRAAVNAQSELEAGGWVVLRDPDRERWIPLERLAFEPPRDGSVDYFAGFERAFKARGNGADREASLTLHPNTDGTVVASLRLVDEEFRIECTYRIEHGKPTPIRYEERTRRDEVLLNANRVDGALGCAAAFVLACLFHRRITAAWRRIAH